MLTYQDLYLFMKNYGLAIFEFMVLFTVLGIYSNAAMMRRVLNWIGEAKYVIYTVGLVFALTLIATVVISLGPKQAEPIVRYTGLALQLFGTATVIWGILNTRKDFHLEPLGSKIEKWYKRCPLLPQSCYIQVDSLTSRSRLTAPDLYVTYSPGDQPTIESIADAMMKNVNALHNKIALVEVNFGTKLQDVVEREELARKQEADMIRQEILSTATGGLHISAIGAAWLLVGILLGTASPEIALFLK